jgi:hypothetical protein
LKELARSYLTITRDLTRVMSRLKVICRSWVILCASQQGATAQDVGPRSASLACAAALTPLHLGFPCLDNFNLAQYGSRCPFFYDYQV